MTVEIAAPPRDPRTYKKLIEKVIEANGEWVRVTFDEVAPGRAKTVKKARLWQAAKACGVKIKTTCQNEAIYVRLRKEGD